MGKKTKVRLMRFNFKAKKNVDCFELIVKHLYHKHVLKLLIKSFFALFLLIFILGLLISFLVLEENFFSLAFLYLYFIFFVNLVFILILMRLISGNSEKFFNVVVELNNSLAFEELIKEIELNEKKIK